jgi:hypothetical protein
MTPEDEAFDDLAKKQGGGFPAKRKMAADKFIAAEESKVGERYGYVPKLHLSEYAETLLEEATRSCNNIDEQRALDALMREALAQPAQEKNE